MPGEGSVFQRKSDGRWVAALSSGPRGNRVFLRRYVHSRADARLALAELKAEAAAGQVTSSTTVGDFLGRWVNEARNIRDTTRHGYKAAVTTHIVPTIGHIRLAELTPAHVETMLRELGERMSPKTLRNVHIVLRRALVQAVRSGAVSRNVASSEYVDTPTVPSAEPRALTQAEVRRLLDAAKDDRLEAAIVVAVKTGLRQGELLGLEWQDVEGPTIRVRQELVYRDGKYHREPPKTERSKRSVPMTPMVRAAIAAHRERTIAAGFVPIATGPVFTNLQGGPLSGSWLTHHFYGLLAKAGIPRLPFKNLRTTFATRLAEEGVSDRVIADLLGHTRTATTQRNYIATRPADVVDAMESVG